MTRTQALGALGSLAGESGRNFDTKAFNAKDPNGGSIGIAQWHSERRWGLEKDAKKSKYGLADFRTQMDYVAKELKTTHKHVLDSMKKATTLKEATRTWTNKFEVPDPKYAHHDKRVENAKYFARVAQQGAKSPQDAIDGVSYGAETALSAIDAATQNDYAGDESLTGAALSYADEEDGEGTSVTRQMDRQAEKGTTKGGLFEQMFTGMAGAVAGATADLSQKTNAVTSKLGLGEVVDGKQVESGDGEDNSDLPAKESDFFGDANFGGMSGALLGGYFAGPVGALIGGIAGQGISRSLSKISDMKQEDADADEAAGIAGGVGRAMDGLFGGFGLFDKVQENRAKRAEAKAKSQFPDAPSGGSGKSTDYGKSGLSEQGRGLYGSSQQVRDAVDSKTPGLY